MVEIGKVVRFCLTWAINARFAKKGPLFATYFFTNLKDWPFHIKFDEQAPFLPFFVNAIATKPKKKGVKNNSKDQVP